MDDLISRTAVLEALIGWETDATDEEIERAVNAIPAVDAKPVVHGEWIDIPGKPEWDQKMCSVCGDYFCCQNNYCPNCGAKNLEDDE